MAQLCPHCKNSTQFKAEIRKAAVVNLIEDDAEIQKEGQKFVYEAAQCLNCGEKVSNNTLIEAHACAKCNDLIPDKELIQVGEDHICAACDALDERSDLKGLSQQALIRKLLELEGKKKPTPASKKAVTVPEDEEE